jgi:hypothetical protein
MRAHHTHTAKAGRDKEAALTLLKLLVYEVYEALSY